MRVFSVSKRAEVRNLLSCGSALMHTSQKHPNVGTPQLVPVPRNVNFVIILYDIHLGINLNAKLAEDVLAYDIA